jgi:hypothetical protein
MLELFKHARTLRGRFSCSMLERACRAPLKAGSSVLRSLIRRNEGTAFGRAHGFSKIRSDEDFRKLVPVREYEEFRPFIKRIMEGERDVLTKDEPLMMTLTSGTTSEPKYIPVTKRCVKITSRLMSEWLYRAERDHSGLLDFASVGIVSRAIEGRTQAGIPYGSASGLIYKKIPAMVRRSYGVPYLVSELNDYDERYFVAARFALSRRVSFIATPNPSTLLRLAEVIVENQERLLRAIHDGTLGAECDGQRELHAQLSSMLRADPERARELERVINSRGRLHACECWPDLKLIGCWTGGTAGIKTERLRDFYGRVSLRDLGYLASEGRVTIPCEDETASGIPALNTSYYEFIPEEEAASQTPRVVSIDELEEGARYSILLTTTGGLYRYRIQDVVEVTGFHHATPLLAFVRKEGETASITGEKMHVNHLMEALRKVARRLAISVEQFRAAPDYEACRYEIYLELEQEVSHTFVRDEVLPEIDRALSEVNMEYEQKRHSKRLAAPRIHLMKRGWAAREMRRHIHSGRRDTQYKWQVLCAAKRADDFDEIAATIETLNQKSTAAFAA